MLGALYQINGLLILFPDAAVHGYAGLPCPSKLVARSWRYGECRKIRSRSSIPIPRHKVIPWPLVRLDPLGMTARAQFFTPHDFRVESGPKRNN